MAAKDLARTGEDEDLFGPIGHMLTFRMSRVQNKLNAQASALLGETAGLTLTQYRVLVLVGSLGPTNLSAIARESAFDKGLLSRNLKALVDRGYVGAEQDTIDCRVQHLTLTEAGRRVWDRARPHMRKRDAHLMAAITDAERKMLDLILDKLEQAAATRLFEA